MTDLEKRADEYADKRAVAYNMPKSSFVIPLLKVAYKTGATQETALLSQHILDLQKDKGELTDRVRELEQQIEKMKCVQNCEFGYDGQYKNNCHKDYSRECNKDCKNCKDWKLRR